MLDFFFKSIIILKQEIHKRIVENENNDTNNYFKILTFR